MYKILILIIITLGVYSCQTSKKSTPNLNSEEYWMKKNMLDRFVGMQEGLFLMYDSLGRQPRVMKSGDSLMLYSIQFGNPDKNGIWLYQKMYMSSFQEEPLTVNFLKITKTSTDTIKVEQFEALEKGTFVNADKTPNMLKSLSFDQLVPVNCDITFTKESQTRFKGTTPICEIDFDAGRTQIYANKFDIEVSGIRLNTSYYAKEDGKYIYKSKGDAYLIRSNSSK